MHKNFYASCVQRIFGIPRSTAAFNIFNFTVFIRNNKGVFKLSATFGIHAKIRLKWKLNFYSFWNINKCSSTPHRAMKHDKFMVIDWYTTRHEIFFDHLRIFLEGHIHVFKNHTFFLQVFFYIVIHHITVILSTNTGERFFFGFGNSESIKCFFNIFRYVFPLARFLRIRTNKINNLIQIEFTQIRSPGRNLCLFKKLKSLQSFFKHPGRFVFLF